MRYLVTFLLLLPALVGFAPKSDIEPDVWVEEQFEKMSWEERIAQLMMIEVRPTYGAAHLDAVRKTVSTYNVGGVIFFKGDPVTQVRLTNELNELSKIPLMVAIDGEWGLSMRLSNTITYPYQLGLGGIRNDNLIYEMGKQIGLECKRIGVHVNFAPVVDINNNPNNPVINYRSFGEDKYNVAKKAWEYARGMQEMGVIACAKHFPGHGDTDVDSHKDLPVIKHSIKRLDSIELFPFKYLIDRGVQSVMTAHLYIPAIDDRPNMAISISDKAINGLLREKMKFEGLAFTDALNMQGVAKFHQPGELELKALAAGNDILLAPSDISKATAAIMKAIKEGKLSENYVTDKVKKVLKYKHWLGLDKPKPIDEENLISDLNDPDAIALYHKLTEAQICVVRDQNKLLPLPTPTTKKIAILAVGTTKTTFFQEEFEHFARADQYFVTSNTPVAQRNELLTKLMNYDVVLIGLHNTSKYPGKNYGISSVIPPFIKQLDETSACVLIDFGNPYNLKNFTTVNSVVMAYQDDAPNHLAAVQALFGVNAVDAILPVNVTDAFKMGQGETIEETGTIKYGFPEDVGIKTESLKKIDSIANKAIADGGTPGCQVLVAKDGRIIFSKAYGYHTYENKERVTINDLYDVASLTKVAATTLAIMKLTEDSAISLDDKLSDYLKVLDTTNKKEITIREVLTHSSGLKDWIPFYQATVLDPVAYDTIYSKLPDSNFCIKVGEDLYMCKSYQSVMFGQIYSSPVKDQGDYRYSDLGMIMLKYIIESVTKTEFDKFMDSVFYRPMDLRFLTFNPLKRFPKAMIVPTEKDADFRKGLIHGYVHDPAAAMLGGVAGHAGLFSNAEDLSRLLQMLLNGGTYNGTRFLNQETIDMFTAYQSEDSRRGLGFDKPEKDPKKISPCSDLASPKCFGHSGFTGTQMWADPETGLIYVFLSNRIYPTATNKLLIQNNVRTDVMDVIYHSTSAN